VAIFRLSRPAEADLMDIGAYALRTWGERPDHSLSQMILKPVAKYWPTTQLLAVPAITFGPACVAWNTVSTLCFTDVSREAFWFRILHERMLPERHVIGDQDETVVSSFRSKT